MILWSKGLGKLVLNMRLSERSSTEDQGEKLVIGGTMGPPTHWDYAVNMNEEDVLDFVDLLKQPAPVRFVVEGERRGALIWTALTSGIVFAWNTSRCFLGLEPRSLAPSPDTQAAAQDRSE
jgi:hypothetical protein